MSLSGVFVSRGISSGGDGVGEIMDEDSSLSSKESYLKGESNWS